jgi:outer membrane receptor for ferrienterochelin and colicin
MSETLTVTGEAPLIQTAMSLQADSLGSQEVRELPVNRRNIQNLIGLTAGVVITGTGAAGGSGGVQMNGVASGGTGITVDGTEANSNPEGRSLTQYGSENQISVMSLDSIAEIQIVKGVLPAEYGGVAGGQINVISRSGTNSFRGRASTAVRMRSGMRTTSSRRPRTRWATSISTAGRSAVRSSTTRCFSLAPMKATARELS